MRAGCSSSGTRRRCAPPSCARSAFFLPAAAPWAMLPLIVREQLGLGAGSFGLLLGVMGVGGVTSGMLLPRMRGYAGRGAIVFARQLFSAAGDGVHRRHPPLGAGRARHVPVRDRLGGGIEHGAGRGAACRPAPGCGPARSRSTSSRFNGALGVRVVAVGLGRRRGSGCRRRCSSRAVAAGWSWHSPCAASGSTAPAVDARAGARRRPRPRRPRRSSPRSSPASRGRILEIDVATGSPRATGAAFLNAMAGGAARARPGRRDGMAALRGRGASRMAGWRSGAVQNWTDHLREAVRLSEEDKQALGGGRTFHAEDAPPPAATSPLIRVRRWSRNASSVHVGAGHPKQERHMADSPRTCATKPRTRACTRPTTT